MEAPVKEPTLGVQGSVDWLQVLSPSFSCGGFLIGLISKAHVMRARCYYFRRLSFGPWALAKPPMLWLQIKVHAGFSGVASRRAVTTAQ